ncbi:ectonucleoside triphosphate diphosphohydrolase 5 [Triplophysa dalaica]|uniref:ectonucleoside triphosphate diphosphohydrolase 5 n=1 Tax=Triplophysa dalaica TaxID=1582913 RepID=UPI0024DF6523|nr:ectonucleoside triphosphate diphosphohydrolase 5 [Triplophysa dalaica]
MLWVQMMLLWTLLLSCWCQVDGHNGMDFSVLPLFSRPANSSHVFYSVMFDAGSTGTRVHIYTFTHKHPDEMPVLDKEAFDSVKPGLSAYADTPEIAGETLRELLRVAVRAVPPDRWKRTPVILRATAGFRLLPASKAQALLQQVRDVFDESPFYAPADSVGIMDGTNEGVLAWVTVNFLTGQLRPNTQTTDGILDLGGGSTQITFLLKSTNAVERADPDYITRLQMFNSTYQLYTHSYLGNGMKAARLSALGSEGLERKVFRSSCLPQKSTEEFSFGGFTYHVRGTTEGESRFQMCYQEMLKVVKGIIKQPHELKNSSTFYAFSYYFEHAVEAGLIDEVKGGVVKIRDFKRRAEELCSGASELHHVNAFLCMDLTYITCLLIDGFGFKDSTVLKLTKKMNDVETSWALGAAMNHVYKFKIH